MTYYLYIPTISEANQLQPQNYANFNFMNSLDNTSIFIPNQEFNISETSFFYCSHLSFFCSCFGWLGKY